MVQLDLRVQDRSLPYDFLGLALLRRCRDFPVVWGRGEIMLVLMVLQDRKAAEDDEVALVVDPRSVLVMVETLW